MNVGVVQLHCHEVYVLAREMGVMREMALVECGLEGLVMRVPEEAVEVPGLGGSLDFFLGKVSGLMRDAEWEDDGARYT